MYYSPLEQNKISIIIYVNTLNTLYKDEEIHAYLWKCLFKSTVLTKHRSQLPAQCYAAGSQLSTSRL